MDTAETRAKEIKSRYNFISDITIVNYKKSNELYRLAKLGFVHIEVKETPVVVSKPGGAIPGILYESIITYPDESFISLSFADVDRQNVTMLVNDTL